MPDSYQAISVIFIEMPILLSNERLIVPAASSCYPTLGMEYSLQAYEIVFERSLLRTGQNCYGSKRFVPCGKRKSTSAEELTVQLGLEKSGIHPRDAEEFRDIFERNMRLQTKTVLRVPRGCDPLRYETEDGRRYYIRICMICDSPIGEFRVPESGFVPYNEDPRKVYDLILGIPLVTAGDPSMAHTARFLFNPEPPPDRFGNRDVYIGRCSYPLHNRQDRLLDIIATHPRFDADEDDGIRLVQGRLPKIRKETFSPKPDSVEATLDRMG